MQSVTKCVNFMTKRLFHQTSFVLKKQGIPYPKGVPVPPDYPTVAYWKLPDYLDPQRWNYLKENRFTKHHGTFSMQRDARKRAVATFYGPLRHRLMCLKRNRILPDELKDIASEEMVRLPKDSMHKMVKRRCVVTGRRRGKRKRWRLSRIVFRKIADHGKMSGIERAFWDGGSQGNYVSLWKQTKKKKH
ncbi:small ribosomal subunit protein uS14m-like [Styela clava]|uniref:28S ribosomal protein S14, mitochondrial-like n=1 Tax=Styela clava TaxID=7725 RepID=UPI001939EA74|nr:28S ribosomal protein S14, mitochondrial-like [Styela clava]